MVMLLLSMPGGRVAGGGTVPFVIERASVGMAGCSKVPAVC